MTRTDKTDRTPLIRDNMAYLLLCIVLGHCIARQTNRNISQVVGCCARPLTRGNHRAAALHQRGGDPLSVPWPVG